MCSNYIAELSMHFEKRHSDIYKSFLEASPVWLYM
jgi:hypothetical protein